MKQGSSIYLIILFLATALACMPEEEILQSNAVELNFSSDTVFFDTLFTTERSTTRRLRVYNPSDKAVVIESIALEGGPASPYTLFVNGKSGKAFGELLLLGKDSLLLLVEARLPQTADLGPFLASDDLVVVNKGSRQEVPVIGYGQNARYFGDQVLECNTVWNSSLPYVIEKSILIESDCRLTIEKGAKLYFKPGAFLYVKGSLHAQGDATPEGGILFRNHRLDQAYENQPGQWGGIVFLEGSKDNLLSYCSIRNAEVGIRLGTPDADDVPDLIMESCRLENHLEAGILSYTSDLQATNTLVANCVGPAVANLAGGNYRYIHCTFANYFRAQRTSPAAVFSDYVVLADNQELIADLRLELINSIVWGNLTSGNEIEILNNSTGGTINLQLQNNLLRTNNNAFAAQDNILNNNLTFVKFQDVGAYNFRPDTLSPAIGAAKPLGLLLDLSGKERDSKPDIGALEYFYVPKKGE